MSRLPVLCSRFLTATLGLFLLLLLGAAQAQAQTLANPALTLVTTEVTEPGNSAANQAAIGEAVTYSVSVTIPDNTTVNTLKIVDSLGAGLTLMDVTGVTASSGLSSSLGTLNAATIVANLSFGSNTITFNLGNVINSDTNGATAETIVITFRTVVLNTLGNQSGTSLITTAQATYQGGSTGMVTSGSVTVVEPFLDFARLVRNVTTGSAFVASVAVSAGDTVQFSESFTVSSTTAFDLVLNEPLPALLSGASVFSVSTSGSGSVSIIGASMVGAFTVSGSTLTINPICNIDIQAGATITVVLQGTASGTGTLGSPATGTMRWTSADGVPGQRSTYSTASTERTGVDGAGGLNDYVTTNPSVSINDVSVTEGDSGTATMTFTVSRSGASSSPVAVNYATANGTATAASDYVAASGTVTIPVGQSSQTLSLSILGDTLFESNESLLVNLSAAGNATISDNQGVGTITDDDSAASIAIVSGNNQTTVTNTDFAAPLVAEVRNAAGSQVQGVTVVLTAPASGASATFATTTNIIFTSTAASGLASSGTVTANGTAGGNYSISAQAVGGTVPSTNFTLSNQPPTALSINDPTVTEGDAGTKTLTFTVTASPINTVAAVTVNWTTADGTATTGAGDYVGDSGTLVFAPGDETKTISVTINGDSKFEADEIFFLNLSNATNASISDVQGVGTITNDDPAPSLSINDVTQPEGDSGSSAFTFTVSLSAVSGVTTTVNYATAGGTATGLDFLDASGTLTFAPGVTTQTLTVQVVGDTRFEPDESFFVNLSGATNATIADGSGRGLITNDDPVPTFSIDDVSASEAAGTITFTVTRTGAAEASSTVDYTTADGTAVSTAGGPGTPDYTSTSGTLIFPSSLAATTTQTVTVALSNDNVYEAVEQFVVNLSNPGTATISRGQGVGTITDDDAAPTISINDVTVSEADGNATFTVTLTGATALPISMDYATVDGTAVSTAGGPGTPDYTATSGTLTFNPSAAGTQTLTVAVPLIDDTTNEPVEQLAVNLSNPTNGASISDAQGIATIFDDDAVPSLSINDVEEAEGNAGATEVTFTISLSAASAQTVTVNYATADGTAVATSDYLAASGTITFAPGETAKAITVLVSSDALFEPDEVFALNLSGPANATIADGQGIGTITNDDPQPAFSINDVSVSEGAGTATFTVTLTGATLAPVTVSYATADGTAVATEGGPGTPDYTATSGTLTFPATFDETSTQTFTVAVTNDQVYEAVEQFAVNLSDVTGPATIADAQGIGTITNNDPAPSFSIDDVTLAEGNSGTTTATFTVTLTRPTALPISVHYATNDGNAVSSGAGSDYTAASGTLTFAPSAEASQTQTISVAIQGDTTYEEDEPFFVDLDAATNGATIADFRGIGTITNDDGPPVVTIGNAQKVEANSAFASMDFTVTLSAPTDLGGRVSYATADGTATTADSDYMATSGVLVFSPGQLTKTISVPIRGDFKVERDETFSVVLSSPDGLSLGAASISATGTITNDDAPTVTFSPQVIRQDAASIEIRGQDFEVNPADNTVAFNLGAAGTVAQAAGNLLTVTFTTPPVSGGVLTAVVTSLGASSGTPVQVAIIDADPFAQDDVAFVQKDSFVEIDVLANDGDSGDDALTITTVATAAHGTATIVNSGLAIRYEPTAGTVVVPDSFSYTITDAHGNTATATVYVSDRATTQAGTYNGLVQTAQGSTVPGNESVGSIKATINGATGKFTGTLKIAGQSVPIAGTFGPDGIARFGKTQAATFAFKSKSAQRTLTLALQLSFEPAMVRITGTLMDEVNPYAVIDAERALYTTKKNPVAPYANVPAELLGKYTVAFVAKTPGSASPQGHGYGFATVAKTGVVKLTGTLADGTKITTSSPVTTTGRWPLYVPLVSGKGSLSGFVQFDATQATTDLAATDLRWFKPANNKAKLYPLGWPAGIVADFLGSKLVRPAAVPPTSILPDLPAPDADGNVTFKLSGAGQAITRAVNLTPQDVALILAPGLDDLTFTLRGTAPLPKNPPVKGMVTVNNINYPDYRLPAVPAATFGWFNGSFLLDPANAPKKRTAFRGAVLQKSHQALGYFLTPTESGAVELQLPPVTQ